MIVHLAAQAGVRYSLENPKSYVDPNINGSFNIIELARAEAEAPAARPRPFGLRRQREDAVCRATRPTSR
mgnify:CR=1 FL=1